MIILPLISAAVWAGEPAKQGFYFGQNLGFMYNPLGAEAVSQIYYRIPLSQSRELLWEGIKSISPSRTAGRPQTTLWALR